MYVPAGFSAALALTILSTVCWGSWANTFKGTRGYRFELFYWDYILGVVLCSLGFALTLGSTGASGEAFILNLHAADPANALHAFIAGVIFNVANVLLVAAIDMAGLSIAFPVAIGLAVVEGVVLSYALQPKGSVLYLGCGVALAIIAVLFDARAYRLLAAGAAERKVAPEGKLVPEDEGPREGKGPREGAALAVRVSPARGIAVSVVSGLLMGAFAPFVTRAMTHGHALTPYSVAVLFSVGALACCFGANLYLMRRPLYGAPVAMKGFWRASARNHGLGILGGVVWGIGTCLNFIAAGLLGVPISYAIGQSAPLIAAAWGVFVWHEFRGAPAAAVKSLAVMFGCYVGAIVLIALAYGR